jgi:ribonuclease HI
VKLEVYCDGSSEGNSTGSGGWAYVIVRDGEKVHEASGHLNVATNNIAEITAAIEGLTYVLGQSGLCDAEEIVLVSDSQLVLRYATGEYKCKAFHLVPYYIKLRKLYGQAKAKTRWVKGHSGDKFNEECDVLAKAGRHLVKDPSDQS